MTRRLRGLGAVVAAGILIVGCDSGGESITFDTRPPSSVHDTQSVGETPPGDVAATSPGTGDVTDVRIDITTRGQAISPLIVGFSSRLTVDQMRDVGVTLNSFGGNPATRYNYMIGNAWNNGADYEFRNTHFDQPSGNASRDILANDAAAGAQSRLAVPTLGWVARDDRDDTCSFPDGDGGCLAATDVGSCGGTGPIADPATANTVSTPDGVRDWVEGLVADGLAPHIIAMDNEPELWGSTHYDVHPLCPTYEEILDKYLTYAGAVRDVAPDALLAGPVACCWYDYWNIAPGPAAGPYEDYLPWFLSHVKAHDDETRIRTLDIVDVHYYPQSDVYNDEIDAETSARRLRSTRSLWDPGYVDESWINQPIRFLPRMKEIIEESYPGTPLLVSEWNFGAEETMNEAMAIADALGIFGREGVYAASYWRHPDVGSPGWYAFKMHGNYDGQGSRFGGDVVAASTSDPAFVSAFAAIDDDAGLLRVMLLNKDPDDARVVSLGEVPASGQARRFTYSAETASGIVSDSVDVAGPIELDPYSITVLEMPLS